MAGALDFYVDWSRRRPEDFSKTLGDILVRRYDLEQQRQFQRELEAQRAANLRENGLAEIAARSAANAAEAAKDRRFRHDEGALRDKADLERAIAVGEAADNRAWNIAKSQDRRARDAQQEQTEKFYRQQGIIRKPEEGDDEFEARAQSELRSRAKAELGALQSHVQDLERRKVEIASRAEGQRQGMIEQSVRAQLGITPQNAAVELAKPQVRAAYEELKNQAYQHFPISASAAAELSSINNELQRTTGLYDEAVKGFRSIGGGFSDLFGSGGTSGGTPAVPQSRSPLPPRAEQQPTIGMGNLRAAEAGRFSAPPAAPVVASDIAAPRTAAPASGPSMFGDVPAITTLGDWNRWFEGLKDPNTQGYADTVFKRTFANQFGIQPEQIGSSTSSFSKERTVARLLRQHPELGQQLAEYENSNDPEAQKILENFYINLGQNLNASRWSPLSGPVLPP